MTDEVLINVPLFAADASIIEIKASHFSMN